MHVEVKRQWRSRLILLLIVVLFFSSFGIAALLRFAGWQPQGHKNYGELLSPPIDFSQHVFSRADGSRYAWQPEQNRWRMVWVSDRPCAAECTAMLDTLHRVWLSQGRHRQRIDVLWFAQVPTQHPAFQGFVPMQPGALRGLLPGPQGTLGYSLYIIDSNGFVVLQYPAGFNPSGLRKDLAKLVK